MREIGKKAIIDSKQWVLPITVFIGVYVMFIVVANLLPTFKHALHNITTDNASNFAGTLGDVLLVPALFADGGIVYIILAVVLFAVAIGGIMALRSKGNK